MYRKNILLGSFILSASLLAPIMVSAGARPPQINVRVYDKQHKDYHSWDDKEDHAYAQYRNEHPKVKVEFKRSNKKQQNDYWTWRHSHSDRD